jgi:hypothetical protein
MKDQYFEIVQEFDKWLSETLFDYPYNNRRVLEKIDDPDYKFTDREKEGMAVVKVMLERISKNVLLAD